MHAIALFFFISLMVSPFAAALAFMITYEEYRKHVAKQKAFRYGIQTAVFTLVIFVGLGIVTGFLFNSFLPP
jgi:hypothetical protein